MIKYEDKTTIKMTKCEQDGKDDVQGDKIYEFGLSSAVLCARDTKEKKKGLSCRQYIKRYTYGNMLRIIMDSVSQFPEF